MKESPFETRARSACKQLWNWVGEQRDKDRQKSELEYGPSAGPYFKGTVSAYSNVRLYMRKFFAGLIDFEEEVKNGKE